MTATDLAFAVCEASGLAFAAVFVVAVVRMRGKL